MSSRRDSDSNSNSRSKSKSKSSAPNSSSISAHDLHRLGTSIAVGSVAFLAAGLFSLLGGVEQIAQGCSGGRQDATGNNVRYLVWPCSLAYFWPLAIPLGTYLVIARWTGYKHFRHA